MEEKYETYSFEYPYKGHKWGIDILATSPEDAQARFKALAWGEYVGGPGVQIYVPFGMTLLRFFNWLTRRKTP
jgi:hypothetical protein